LSDKPTVVFSNAKDKKKRTKAAADSKGKTESAREEARAARPPQKLPNFAV